MSCFRVNVPRHHQLWGMRILDLYTRYINQPATLPEEQNIHESEKQRSPPAKKKTRLFAFQNMLIFTHGITVWCVIWLKGNGWWTKSTYPGGFWLNHVETLSFMGCLWIPRWVLAIVGDNNLGYQTPPMEWEAARWKRKCQDSSWKIAQSKGPLSWFGVWEISTHVLKI